MDSGFALRAPRNDDGDQHCASSYNFLRDRGFIEFVSRGNYRLRSRETRHGLVSEFLQMRPLPAPMDRRMVRHV
jgi:hypothetical protein